jgi:hypothetical protein
LASSSSIAAQKPPLEYQLKAAFLFNFTRFIDWPADAFTSPSAPFVIGIVGNDPFGNYLDEMVRGEKTGDHPIIVQHYRTAKDISNCQLLYINLQSAESIKEALSNINPHNVLTVSDADKFMKQGGDVRFFEEDNKIKIQINMAAAKASGLEISSKLLRIAKIW